MRIIAARKHKFGFELPSPTCSINMEILSHINFIISGKNVIFNNNVSNGTASYKIYTDDEDLGNLLVEYYTSILK